LFEITDTIASFSWSLAEVKNLHAELSAVMRSEADEIANRTSPLDLAA